MAVSIYSLSNETFDDIRAAEEDVPLFEGGYLTEAGEFYLADNIAVQVIENHAIQPHWVRNGEQIRELIREGVELALGVKR